MLEWGISESLGCGVLWCCIIESWDGWEHQGGENIWVWTQNKLGQGMQDLLLMPGDVGVQRGTMLLLVPFGCHLDLCYEQSCLG